MGRRLLLLWREQEVDAAYTTWNIEATSCRRCRWCGAASTGSYRRWLAAGVDLVDLRQLRRGAVKACHAVTVHPL